MNGPLRTERHDGVEHVWLDAPDRRNALSLQMLSELEEAVRRCAEDDSRGLLIDHTGAAFSAGIDVKERAALRPGERTHSEALADLYRALWDHPKPVLCRVGGAARGGALGLLVCADVVVANTEASFAFSEVRVGVAPALVGALAAAKLGAGRVSPWLLTGEVFGTEEAVALGLVTRVVTDDGSAAMASLVDAVGLSAPGATALTKCLIRRFMAVEVSSLIGEMTSLSAELFASSEGEEGMRAFAERRPPSWVRHDD